MSRSVWAWARLLGGVAIIAVLVWRLGTGPFLDGVRLISVGALVAAFGIGAVVTVGCAWRWRVVAAGLGAPLGLGTAVAAYYRSQFLNSTLPGGVVGDVHRAVRHGRDTGNVGRGVRAVVWERVAGQVVQLAVALVVLAVFPSPVRTYLPVVAAALVVFAAIGVVLVRVRPQSGSSRWLRAVRTAGSDIRHGLIGRRTWVGVVVVSAVVVAGHLATFVIAARTAGATASLVVLLPLGMLALLAMGVPLNVAGWGPREGVAAWSFAAAGLTATQGVSTAVTYGVLVLVASLPGAAVLLARWLSRRPDPLVGATAPVSPAPAWDGVSHG